MAPTPLRADLDLTAIVRPGDHVLWGQGAGEPRTLTETLVAQRAQLGPVTVFLGSTFSDTLAPEYADNLHFTAFGGIGRNAALARAGVLDIVPCHISSLPRLLSGGQLPVDVVFVQLSPADADGNYSLGLVADYVGAAMAAARVVVAEINDQVPRTCGDTVVTPEQLDYVIHTSREPVFVSGGRPGAAEVRIGELVSELVPDHATLQLGIGNVSDAVARGLVGHRDLGVHGGLVGDWLVELVEVGAVTNAHKPIDPGVSVTGAVFGTRRLYDFADDNPALALHPVTYTHDPSILRRIDRFVAVNGAIEVDLSGQVNAETIGARNVGAVAGQVDFVRGAMAGDGGLSVIALPSTARAGEITRIVPRLADGVVTTPRSDADVVVTEHGVARLRGVPVAERARRLTAIADPRHRDELRAAAAFAVC